MIDTMITPDTWIISDTHFGHKAIVGFCNRPMNHNDLMEENWYRAIHNDDETVLHLGDIATWKTKPREHRDTWLPILMQLPGRKLWVPGNHDKNGASYYKRAGFQEIGELLGTFIEEDVTREGVPYQNKVNNHGFYWDYEGKRVLFSHYPDQWLLDWDINIHGHIHNNPYSPKIDKSRRYINVSVEVMNYRPVRLSDILNP